MDAPSTSKRIIRDITRLREDAEASQKLTSGVYFTDLYDDNMEKIFTLLIGPDDSPYKFCPLPITIEPNGKNKFHSQLVKDGFNYPHRPPTVEFLCPFSIRIHPNLYKEGKVCLTMLGTWSETNNTDIWIAQYTFIAIVQQIFGICDNEPLRGEPGYRTGRNDTVQEYTDYVRYVCLRESIEKIYLPIGRNGESKKFSSECNKLFAGKLNEYWKANKEKIIAYLTELSEKFDNQRITYRDPYGNSTFMGEYYNYKFLIELAGKM